MCCLTLRPACEPQDGASDPMCKVFWCDEEIMSTESYTNDNNPEIQEKVSISTISSSPGAEDVLRIEVWDDDGDGGTGDFLGQVELSGNFAELSTDGRAVTTELLPANSKDFPLQKSTKGYNSKFVGGSMQLGDFELYGDDAAKALEKATAQEGKAAVVFQEKKVAATKEKEEADEQHTKATEKLRIAEEAKERATKEREDCVKAQARLEKEVSTTACTRLISLGRVVTPMALCR